MVIVIFSNSIQQLGLRDKFFNLFLDTFKNRNSRVQTQDKKRVNIFSWNFLALEKKKVKLSKNIQSVAKLNLILINNLYLFRVKSTWHWAHWWHSAANTSGRLRCIRGNTPQTLRRNLWVLRPHSPGLRLWQHLHRQWRYKNLLHQQLHRGKYRYNGKLSQLQFNAISYQSWKCIDYTYTVFAEEGLGEFKTEWYALY